MRTGVVADDLTGALEMGALLAGHGLRCVVSFAAGAVAYGEDATVIDTESRHLNAETAAMRVRQAVEALRTWGAAAMFKKIDSTLRGPVEAEVRAFAGERPLVFTPAYPAMGRTVREGRLYVHGPAAPETVNLPIADAAADEDLAALVAKHPDAAFAGSGGLGRAWVASLRGGGFTAPPVPRPERCLVVCGSRHPVSREQALRARASGIPVLMTPGETGDAERAAADIAREAARQRTPDLLVVFGGDTAYAVLRELGIAYVRALREIVPGVALSEARGMMIVTKAGGFGQPHIVSQILGQLP